MKARLILAVVLAGVAINAATAYGTDYTTKGTGGDWNDNATWNPSGYPDGTGDTATIQSGDTVNVASANGTAICGSLTVADSATAILNMQDGGLLQISNTLSIGANGVFRFSAADGEPRPDLQAIGTLTVSGRVKSTGAAGGVLSRTDANTFTLNSGAEILADGGDITIEAPMLINGTCRATSSADLSFSAAPAAASTGLIHVDSASARVLFGAGSTQTFTGALDFYAEAGEIVINDSVITAGGTRIDTGGKVDCAAGESYQSTGTFTGP